MRKQRPEKSRQLSEVTTLVLEPQFSKACLEESRCLQPSSRLRAQERGQDMTQDGLLVSLKN